MQSGTWRETMTWPRSHGKEVEKPESLPGSLVAEPTCLWEGTPTWDEGGRNENYSTAFRAMAPKSPQNWWRTLGHFTLLRLIFPNTYPTWSILQRVLLRWDSFLSCLPRGPRWWEWAVLSVGRSLFGSLGFYGNSFLPGDKWWLAQSCWYASWLT